MKVRVIIISCLLLAILFPILNFEYIENVKADPWVIEIVDMEEAQVGRDTSIAVDSNGNSHISYFDNTNDKIKYAHWNGSDWILETLDVTISAGGYTSIALDSSDHPHASYDNEASDDLRYSYWNGSDWIRQTPDSAGLLAHYTSITLDSNDYPHISYYDWTNSNNGDLKYTHWDGISWDTHTIDTAGASGYFSSIEVDSNDIPHIAYVQDMNKVKYAYWDGISWNIEIVGSGQIASTSLELDTADNPHITYCNNYNVIYAVKEGSWSFETVDSSGGCMDSSLALDISDTPHISYVDGWNRNLKYTTKGGANWDFHTVDTYGDVGRYNSIAIDTTGNPHISYFNDTVSPGDLKYASWTGSTWIVETLDKGSLDVGFFTSLALDSNGDPHISYMTQRFWYLRYANKTEGSWNYETAVIGGGTHSSIALDSNDWPHISYYKIYNNLLRYSYWNGIDWVAQDVDSGSVGEYSSIALNDSDYPRISYYDETHSRLKYAEWTGGSWIKTNVDSSGMVGGYTSLALDKNGYPHISYYRDTSGDLMHAKWTGSTWDIDIVDSTGDVGRYTSLVLDNNDYPHISYYDVTNQALKHAWWDGSSWQTETVDTFADVGKYNSIDLDSTDSPHISYYDATNKDLKFASWNGTWTIDIVDPKGDVGKYTSLKLDLNNSAHIAYFDETNFELKYAKNALGPLPPSAPRLQTANSGDSFVNLTWSAPLSNGGLSITNYLIYRDTISGGKTFLTEIGNILWYNDTSVTNGITYYYKVSARNIVGEGLLSNELSANPIGFCMFLNQGWNLISIPLVQPDTRLGTVLSSISGSYNAVRYYDTIDINDHWKHNHTSKSSNLNDLIEINHIIGFWIYITEPDGVLLKCPGNNPTISQGITLNKGWNLVGYPSLTNYNRTDGLNNTEFGIHINKIMWYNTSSQTWHSMEETAYFQKGIGYWFHAREDVVWNVPL